MNANPVKTHQSSQDADPFPLSLGNDAFLDVRIIRISKRFKAKNPHHFLKSYLVFQFLVSLIVLFLRSIFLMRLVIKKHCFDAFSHFLVCHLHFENKYINHVFAEVVYLKT